MVGKAVDAVSVVEEDECLPSSVVVHGGYRLEAVGGFGGVGGGEVAVVFEEGVIFGGDGGEIVGEEGAEGEGGGVMEGFGGGEGWHVGVYFFVWSVFLCVWRWLLSVMYINKYIYIYRKEC